MECMNYASKLTNFTLGNAFFIWAGCPCSTLISSLTIRVRAAVELVIEWMTQDIVHEYIVANYLKTE